MATASGDGKGRRRFGMPFVACAVVLALLGGSGVAVWTADGTALQTCRSRPRASRNVKGGTDRARRAPPGAEATTTSSAGPAATAPTHHGPAQETTVSSSPSHSEAGDRDPAASAAERPEPRNTTCTVDLDPWPADGAGQAKAVQNSPARSRLL